MVGLLNEMARLIGRFSLTKLFMKKVLNGNARMICIMHHNIISYSEDFC